MNAGHRPDLSAIQGLVGRTRRRIRGQWALEGATTATVLAAAAVLASVFAVRVELIDRSTGIALVASAIAIIVLGAIVKAARPLDDETVARRIDRASNLSDRLSTAIAFRRALADFGTASATATGTPTDSETEALMAAAIADGVRAVPRANVKAAAPFHIPRDYKAAAGFVLVSALAAGLAIPMEDRSPHLTMVVPSAGVPGAVVVIHGDHLFASLVPDYSSVYLGTTAATGGRPVFVVQWLRDEITVRIPTTAPIGDTTLTAQVAGRSIGPVAFTVIDPKDQRYHKADSVALDPDEKAYVEAILAELRALAKREHLDDLEKFADSIEKLLKDAEEGKISKEQLLAALSKAEDLLNAGKEPDQQQVDKQLGELGKELAKAEQTKELGKALEQHDLEKAKQELEKLAAKLDPQEQAEQQKELEKQLADPTTPDEQKKELQKQLDELKAQKPMTEQQKQELQKQLEQTAKTMEKQQQEQKSKQQQMQQQVEEQIRQLQKKKDQAKTPQEQLDAERALQKKQDELKKLQKDQEEKEQSAQRESVKRLQRDLEKAAESLEQPKDKDGQQESQEEKQEREKQASQKIKEAARETGRVDQDQRKQATQKKLASQMDDLREAMRRAKQKGNKGPQDPFNKNGKNQDYASRSRGQKGSGQAWKPGQGQPGGPGQGQGQPGGQGQGQGQPGGQGQGPGQNGNEAGVGHDPNLTDSATNKSGNTKDQDLQGTTGKNGGSTRETILAAAQKGFASARYQKVYADYQRIVEEVMRTEKLPSSYKYYVKRYFAKIHPSGSPSDDKETETP